MCYTNEEKYLLWTKTFRKIIPRRNKTLSMLTTKLSDILFSIEDNILQKKILLYGLVIVITQFT